MTVNVHHKKSKWKGYGEKATFICCCRKYKLVQAQEKMTWEVPKQTNKQKNTAELQYDSEILLLGIYPKFLHQDLERSVLPHLLKLFTITKT